MNFCCSKKYLNTLIRYLKQVIKELQQYGYNFDNTKIVIWATNQATLSVFRDQIDIKGNKFEQIHPYLVFENGEEVKKRRKKVTYPKFDKLLLQVNELHHNKYKLLQFGKLPYQRFDEMYNVQQRGPFNQKNCLIEEKNVNNNLQQQGKLF